MSYLLKSLLNVLTVLLLADWANAAAAETAQGLLIQKDNALTADEFATVTEYASVEAFPTVSNFIDLDGNRFSVVSGEIVQTVDYGHMRPVAFQEVLQEGDLVPIGSAIQRLEALSLRYPAARKHLAPFCIALKREVEHFRKGQGKWNGQWYATRESALEERNRPLRLATAEREKQEAMSKAEAARVAAETKAETARVATEAKIRAENAEREMAIEKDKAQKFNSEVSALLKHVLMEGIWTERIDELKSVQPLPEDLVRRAEQADARWKELQNEITTPEARQIGEKAIPGLEAVRAWSRAAQSFAADDAPEGALALRELLSKYSAVSHPEISPIWDQMLNIYKTCQQREEAAQAHVKKADQLAAIGTKNSQAITEYQAAYALFPSAAIAGRIKELRTESLGL